MPTHSIFADHHQFYLFDEAVCPPYPEDIADADLRRKFKAVPNLVAVYTDDAAEFVIAIEHGDDPPQLDHSSWASIVEGPLSVPSGRIVLASPSSELVHASRIAVPPGTYRVQVAAPHGGEGTLQVYLVSLWPSTMSTIEVIKPSVQRAA
jgi:hypothetical protein